MEVPRDHLKQHHAKRVDVCPDINALGIRKLFRRHVSACASRRPCLTVRNAQSLGRRIAASPRTRVIENFCQTEVGDFESAAVGE